MQPLTTPTGTVVLVLSAVAVATWVLVAVTRSGPAARGRWLLVARCGWAVFVLVVLALTVSQGSGGGVNLRPLATVRLQLTGLSPDLAAYNLLGNLALLVPYALLARAAWGWRVGLGTASGVALSVAVEVCQVFTGRSADVDDVLLNGAGALGGAVLAAVVVRVVAAGRTGTGRAAPRPAPAPAQRATPATSGPPPR